MSIRLDYTNMLADVVSGGVADAAWTDAASAFARAHATLESERARGVLGFLDLPGNEALHAQSTAFAAGASGRFDDVLLLGIGGSALGPIALRTALRPSGWNLLDEQRRGGYPRLHVLDNVDPATITALLDRLPPERTLVIVTSKSGGTAETMAQYLVVRAHFAKALGDERARGHFVLVTDPEKGALRAIARQEGIAAVDIPSNVGGRFSVLSPVGILPAALIGIDTAQLLAGAADMAARCTSPDPRRNLAGAFATLQWLADTVGSRPIQVLMPYSDPLRDIAAWFVQLWAESLGKVRPDGRHVGPTPVVALGATDQHSQVQLFMEGPQDKTVTFLAVRELAADAEIPHLHGDIPELAYLGGHRLGELLDIERRATAGALATRGRPNMTIELDRVDAFHLGSLLMLFEIATVYGGALYQVDPMNQPGVELGKQFTYAMLGRADAEQARQEWNMLPKSNPQRVI